MADAKAWERQSRYNDRMTRQYPIRLNTKTDADVIEHLDGLSESRAGYIKRLIREDMMKADRWHVQEYEVEADLFLKTDWTEEDEEKRAYMVRGWLDAFAQRDPKTGEWYVPQPDGWEDGIAERKGEVIEELLSAPDAPEGIREWYEEH